MSFSFVVRSPIRRAGAAMKRKKNSSATCPFTDYYTNQSLGEYAERKNVPLTIHHIENQRDGHKMVIPWVINSVFYLAIWKFMFLRACQICNFGDEV